MLSDIISRRYFVGATAGVLVGYAWHHWSLADVNMADTLVLTFASEAFLLLGSIFAIWWVRR